MKSEPLLTNFYYLIIERYYFLFISTTVYPSATSMSFLLFVKRTTYIQKQFLKVLEFVMENHFNDIYHCMASPIENQQQNDYRLPKKDSRVFLAKNVWALLSLIKIITRFVTRHDNLGVCIKCRNNDFIIVLCIPTFC